MYYLESKGVTGNSLVQHLLSLGCLANQATNCNFFKVTIITLISNIQMNSITCLFSMEIYRNKGKWYLLQAFSNDNLSQRALFFFSVK